MGVAQRDLIRSELSDHMNRYAGDVLNWDRAAIDRFWGDSEDFVFAGDGDILGGHDKWSALLDQYEGQVDRWLSFEYRNLHVVVLSPEVACVTTEFEHSRISTEGDTVNVRGAWTYVFKKSDEEWDVIHTNGTHIDY